MHNFLSRVDNNDVITPICGSSHVYRYTYLSRKPPNSDILLEKETSLLEMNFHRI